MPLPDWAQPPPGDGWHHHDNYSSNEVVWRHEDGRVQIQTAEDPGFWSPAPDKEPMAYKVSPHRRIASRGFVVGACGVATVVAVVVSHVVR